MLFQDFLLTDKQTCAQVGLAFGRNFWQISWLKKNHICQQHKKDDVQVFF